MMIRWVNKGVDLSLLVERVQLFFETNNFKTKVEKLGNGWMVLAVRSFDGRSRSVLVNVCGRPDDFTIDFSFRGYERQARLVGPFVTFFGLGAFVRREFELMDFFKVLEEKFWAYVEREVADGHLNIK
jgi:hypothetical protein